MNDVYTPSGNVQALVDRELGGAESEQDPFRVRLERYLPELCELLGTIYEGRSDLSASISKLVKTLSEGYENRSARLRRRDTVRLEDELWYRHENMVGMACYVDLFAGDLKRLHDKIPYLRDLGITYLHLMPLYKSPEDENDGGYAVTDYRTVDPKLGTLEDLQSLAGALDDAGISLVLDFVFNHTADDHEWAQAARQGDPEYVDYYWIFSDRTLPDAYEENLREIFPQTRRGSFTHLPETDQWVWTTFNSFQWDLNYSNPAVFTAIVGEMLFLANLGCDVLRLDALAFIWKDMGTSCENRPNAIRLIQAFNLCLRMVAPATVFKSEAIVHPDDVAKYIGPDKCRLSYNPLTMALLWNSLATRKTRLLNKSLTHRFEIDDRCSWVNYARCHDDIGWTFDDGDANALGINGADHRGFLNQFYTGQFPGSFARGLGFQYNPENGDCRVCGSLASLCGLESALEAADEAAIEAAIARILLVHSILLSIGGIPLIYAGDEMAVLNDYRFMDDPGKRADARWVNRPFIDEDVISRAMTPGTPQYRVHQGIRHMIRRRKAMPVLGRGKTRILEADNVHLFSFLRYAEGALPVMVVCNFSDSEQFLNIQRFDQLGLLKDAENLLDPSATAPEDGNIRLKPYEVQWLQLVGIA